MVDGRLEGGEKRVSGTNGHLILSQLPFLSLLISPSKLSSSELSFTSDILQRSETPFL